METDQGGELGSRQVAVAKADLKRLRDIADRLAQRLESLETLLDAERNVGLPVPPASTDDNCKFV